MKYAPLAGFLLLCVLLGVGLGLDNDDLPSQLIDKPVPAFSLPQLVADAAAAPQLTQTSLQSMAANHGLGRVHRPDINQSGCTFNHGRRTHLCLD